ncbi:unnamed protein product [Thlaspi arvense]|uniref:Pentatricopeptide repeat-containing protein n=1 Tax=Thlaspi arvense TaxID=13288 RepID=A0AAU9RU76_THLAR|nr:unnamed protein product [Thlaspi arvense]
MSISKKMGSHLCSKIQALSSKIKQASSNGKWREVVSGYSQIQRAGVEFDDPFVFPIVFKACAKLSWLSQGRCIHASLFKRGFEYFVSVGNSIADFYMKCGDFCSAMREFDCMVSRDSVSWNVIVFGLLDHGFEEEGLWWFSNSRVWGFEPNVSTLVLVIHAFRSFRSYVDGEKIHGYVIRSGCNLVDDARTVLDSMTYKDVVSCSTMISGLARCGRSDEAIAIFSNMKDKPNAITVINLLDACSVSADLRKSKWAHGKSWEDVAKIRRLVKERNVRVVAGYSMVLEGTMARRFLAGEKLNQSDCELNDVVQSLHRCTKLEDRSTGWI